MKSMKIGYIPYHLRNLWNEFELIAWRRHPSSGKPFGWSRCHPQCWWRYQSNSWSHPNPQQTRHWEGDLLPYSWLHPPLQPQACLNTPGQCLWPPQVPPPWISPADQVSGCLPDVASWLWRKAEGLGISISGQDDLFWCCSGWWEEKAGGGCFAPRTIRHAAHDHREVLEHVQEEGREDHPPHQQQGGPGVCTQQQEGGNSQVSV